MSSHPILPSATAPASHESLLPRLSIGAVSRAAGIPVETLRTWERRYGFPIGLRDDGGQRQYDVATLLHLQLIKQALGQGMRASQIVPLPLHELRHLLAQTEREVPPPAAVPRPAPVTAPPPLPAQSSDLARFIDAIQRFDGDTLAALLQRAAHQIGCVAFLDDLARPLMIEVGQRWASGDLTVAHEHFATEHLRARLADLSVPDRHGAPCVICANLPGELHSLGLEMAAVVLRQTGLRALYLGADMPLGDLARTVHFVSAHMDLAAVLVSLSASVEARNARDQLAQLRSLVPPHVPVLAGGSGAPSEVAGIVVHGSVRELQAWALDRTGA
ncbi:MAG: MerR family transcriptional regulator [Deltaproteobacteria bacterium]|nr:MerR family transcriptional regulator [Deltaproteobacteria bacterium]